MSIDSVSSPESSGQELLRPRQELAGARPVLDAELQLSDMIMTLRRRKIIIIGFAILGILVAVLSTILAEKMYSSTTTIEVNKESSSGLGLDDLSGIAAGMGAGGADELSTGLQTQQAVIENDNTALNVIQKLNLMARPPYATPPRKRDVKSTASGEQPLPLDQDPEARERVRGIFRGRLKVKLIKGTRLISVTYTDEDPKRAAEISNAVVDVYLDDYTQARYRASEKASSWLTNQLSDLKAKVTESQKKMNDYQREAGLVGMTLPSLSTGPHGTLSSSGEENTGGTNNATIERLADLNRELTQAEVARIAKEAIYRMTETQDPDVVLGAGMSELAKSAGSDSVLSAGGQALSLLQGLRQQQAQLKVQYAAAATKYGARNPALTELQNQATAMDGQIKAELQRIHQRAKNEFDLAKITEAGVQKSVSDQEQQVSNLSDSIDKLLLLHQEESSNRLLYQDLYTKLEEANVSAGSRASNITVVDPARIAARPSSPKAVLNLAMGLGAGLFLGVFAAFSRDYFDDSVVTPAQVELLTNSPVLGLVPAFATASRSYGRYLPSAGRQDPPEGQSPAWLIRAPRSSISEAYRQLRTSLLMARADQSLRTMLFTSPLPGDGKSTSCFNTAVAYALQGGRVLVIDADMRRPNMHRLAECQNETGLSQYLTNNLQAEEVIQQHGEIKKLCILSAGLAPPMPAELLGSKRFADALRQFRKEFDFVFIDAPPLLPITDSVVISHHVDGVILVIRSGVTTKSVLRRSLTTLGNAPLVGLLLNAADTNSADFGSTYGYYGDGDYYDKNSD